MQGERGRVRRVADAVTAAVPGSVVRWAASRGAPMARISGRSAVGTAALAQALSALAQPPARLRVRSKSVGLADLAERVGRAEDELVRWHARGLLGEGRLEDGEVRFDRDVLDRAALIDLALTEGADEEQLAKAAADGNLVLVALERVMVTRGKWTGPEAAERAGIEPQLAAGVWEALGLPGGQLAARTFDQDDVAALRTVGALGGLFTDEDLAETSAVVGRAMGEVSAALTGVFRRRLAEPLLGAGGTETDVVLRLVAMRDVLVPTIGPLLEVALRRHLDYALRSEISIAMEELLDPDTDMRIMAVAFADLVGFTAASEALSPPEVRGVAQRLFAVAEPVVAAHGGRVVKRIGDAVMYAGGDPARCAAAAVEIVERVEADEALPPVRVGIAHGPVLPAYADYFGRTVNLASRLCSAADPGEVLLHSDAALDDAFAEAGLAAAPRKVRGLKGIGTVPAQRLRRA